MTIKEWTDIGIGDESSFTSMLYNEHSSSVVVQFYNKISKTHGVKSIYIRSADEVRYHRLTEESDIVTYDNIVMSCNKPHLFVNSLKARKEKDQYLGYDWHSLDIIDLNTKEIIASVAAGELEGEVDNHHPWVSSIHSACSDEGNVICSIGIPHKINEDNIKIEYYLSKLDVNTKCYKVVTKLNNVFL